MRSVNGLLKRIFIVALVGIRSVKEQVQKDRCPSQPARNILLVHFIVLSTRSVLFVDSGV